MAKPTLAVFLLCFFSAFAAAQDQKQNFKQFLRDPSTITQFSLVGTSFIADGLSTQAKFGWPAQLTDQHGVELNPIVNANHSALVTAGYFTGTFAAYGASSYMLRRHRIIRWISTGAILAAEGYAIRSNYNLIDLAKSQQAKCMAVPLAICPR